MSQITNDAEFKHAIKDLDASRQRLLAARFVEHVLPLNTDERIARIVKVAADNAASANELSNALRTAKAATFDSHTRCGSEGNWKEQAGYFVSRAAVAALTVRTMFIRQPCLAGRHEQPNGKDQHANCADDSSTSNESEQQYQILFDYLNS